MKVGISGSGEPELQDGGDLYANFLYTGNTGTMEVKYRLLNYYSIVYVYVRIIERNVRIIVFYLCFNNNHWICDAQQMSNLKCTRKLIIIIRPET